MSPYDSRAIRVIGPIDFAREMEPKLFIGGVFDPIEMCTIIAASVLQSGGSLVELSNDGIWWVVSSPFDWLPLTDTYECFFRVVRDARLGNFGIRAEVYLWPFCSTIVTVGQLGTVILKDEVGAVSSGWPQLRDGAARLVAFVPLKPEELEEQRAKAHASRVRKNPV